MDKSDFIKQELESYTKKYDLAEYEIKEPEHYVKYCRDDAIIKLTVQEKKEFIEMGYEDYVVDLQLGDWTYYDGEVIFSLDDLDRWILETEQQLKEGYRNYSLIDNLIQYNYAWALYEQYSKEEKKD